MKHLYFLSLMALMSMPSFASNTLPQRRLPAVQKAEAGLPGLSSIISSQPEGTLYKDLNHYFEGCYTSSDELIYDYLGDGYVSDIVEDSEGNLYIKNPFGFLNMDAEIWVKATKAADGKYNVELPQAVYDNAGGNDPILYAWRYIKDESDNYATKDAKSQVVSFELRNDSLVKVGDSKAFIGLGAADGYFYGYGDTVSIYNKIKDAAPVPADKSKAVAYKVIYNDATDTSTGMDISVVFEGNEVFFGGLDDTQPDLWFSGTIEGDRLMLKKWQYMGVDRKNTTYALGQPSHMYLYPFGWGNFTDEAGNEKFGLYEVESPALAYDAATKTFSTDELTLAINRGHHYYPFVYYTKPKFVPASAAGVESIEAEEEGVVTYTDLAGRRVERPTKGVYVRTVKTKDGKVKTDKMVMAR
ncbi:hypothetical protein [Prevotella sp.]|uniref:hypothetical protein n=1 Tax=Prevotella sp. TaxID=59823 RepID=UPI0025CF4832|nr:hypothetical protein [Prevotella sp.]